MAEHTSPEREFYDEAKTVSPPFWIAVGFGFGILFMALLNNLEGDLVENFIGCLTCLAPEVIGIAFTIGVIERLNRQRDKENLMKQLISQARSGDPRHAWHAFERLRHEELLQDGSLNGACFKGVILSSLPQISRVGTETLEKTPEISSSSAFR